MEETYTATELSTGYRWEATLFLEVWKSVEEEYGMEKAKDICGNAMYEAGVRFGKAMAKKKGRNDLKALKEVWEELYPVGPDNEWDGDKFVARGDSCIIKDTLQMYDIPEERLEEIQKVFCDGDKGFVNGFNPEIEFTWGGRIFRDEPRCEWIMEKA